MTSPGLPLPQIKQRPLLTITRRPQLPSARTSLVLAFLLLGTACHGAVAPNTQTTGRATLAIGQEFTPSASLRIAFDRVQSDSRCPVDVVCVQAGTAEVVIRVRRANLPDQSYTLRSLGTPNEIVVDGYRIRLEEVQPAPHAAAPIPSADYRITLSAVSLPD